MIRLDPAYQSYIWGGDRIPSYFQRDLTPGRYAESWEVSDREEGMSIIGNGPLKGKTLREFFGGEKFPLLVKIIDSKEHLSVQVHPDEIAAKVLGAEPKTEMWIALEKSTVYAGLKSGVGREAFLEALKKKRLEECLQGFSLKKGEFLFIPAGTIHAIGADSLLLEVQQNSNTTYRIYDWGREGRELHLEKGLSCVNWEKQRIVKYLSKSGQTLVSNPYFNVKSLDIKTKAEVPSTDRFQILFCVSGEAHVGKEKILPGMTHLIPRSHRIQICGTCHFILICCSLPKDDHPPNIDGNSV